MKGKFLFLGTGSSLGVPVVGCGCETCGSQSLYNTRTRTSGLLKIEGKNYLIDVGPDFRLQALKHGIHKIDGLILTHTHFDHIAGIDELRIFSFLKEGNIPCLLSVDSYEELEKRYYYLFKGISKEDSATVLFDFLILKNDQGQVRFVDLPLIYFSYFQGSMKVLGFRLGNFAYVTDIKKFDETLFEILKDVDCLVLSALRKEESRLHFNLNDAIHFAERIGAKKTYLTHIAHEIEHLEVSKELPDSVNIGYDGLEIDIVWK
jgi:phosphoribosyl 1,2-cyclic phosphate phosphodiesterase